MFLLLDVCIFLAAIITFSYCYGLKYNEIIKVKNEEYGCFGKYISEVTVYESNCKIFAKFKSPNKSTYN